MKFRLLLIAATVVAMPLTFIAAPFPEELLLQHSGTVLGLGGLACSLALMPPSSLSFGCVLVFIWLHMIGARWIYSYVPYDDLARFISGYSLSECFGWERNHYDRLVHFASGLLGVAPASELLQRFGGMRSLGAALMGIACVMAVGAFYEIVEWQIAIQFSPAQAEAYNGQQGDVWDPQKDLLFAGIGAFLSAGLLCRWSPKQT